MDFKMHEYTHAIVAKFHKYSGDLNLEEARRQHECYVRLLSELNLNVIEVELDGTFKENNSLEDIAVVCHGIALFPKPKTEVAENNITILKKILKKDLGQTIVDQVKPEANFVGADVLFTGREFFVGISDATNEAGASVVADAFPEFPCTPLKISSGAGNLKSYITAAGPDILCVGGSKEAKELIKRMEREATFSYQTVSVPEDEAANCLYVNGTLIHRGIEEIPESFKVFCEKIDFARRSICIGDLNKLGGRLSSCSILVRKP